MQGPSAVRVILELFYDDRTSTVKTVPKAEMRRMKAGHPAVEDQLGDIASQMQRFHTEEVAPGKKMAMSSVK